MKIRVNTEIFTLESKALAKKFSSGNIFLDEFIKSPDAFNDSIGKTFVWINEKRTEIIGYYNIGVGYIDMYNGDEKYKVGGAIHLNFFALNNKYRGIVIGKRDDGKNIRVSDQLFYDFMQKVFALRQKYIGFSFVTLAATEWDEEAGLDYIEYRSGSSLNKMWIETPKSLDLKMKAVVDGNAAGLAFWKLGLETSAVWDTVAKYCG